MWFDASSVLAEHKDEYIYYRTDHHWTTLGAWYAYQAWAEAKGFSPAPLSDYTVETLTTDFKGTIESKVGVDVVPDTIQSFMKKDLPAYTLDYNNGQKEQRRPLRQELSGGKRQIQCFLRRKPAGHPGLHKEQ